MRKNYAIAVFFAITQITSGAVTIETKLGHVRGTVMLSRNGKRFNAFLGLPYAKPPVGELRFKDPLLYDETWKSTYDATKYPPVCPQLNGSNAFIGQEDCLYLNVYVPQETIIEKLPVWVFIYGGRRLSGNASPNKHGPHYIMDKPVVFVTLTYRINILGYLSTEDNVISGNFGLKDEVIVLQWIREHISSFGGDPSNVTLSGGSTGGIDVSLHLCSPLSKGLFHRAITQSGHPLKTVMKPGEARLQAWTLARIVGCGYAKCSEELLQCLQAIPVEVIVNGLLRDKHSSFSPAHFSVVIEPPDSSMKFLENEPLVELKKSHNIPWLLGVNADEGSIAALALFSDPAALRYSSQNVREILPNYFSYRDSDRKDAITDAILEKYIQDKPSNKTFQQIARICGTQHFFIGAIDCALEYNGPRYFYVYDHENAVNYAKNYYLRGLYSKNEKIGVCHGEELRSLQHYPSLLPPIVNGDDRIVSDQVISLWYNFVVNGDPNGKNKPIIWHAVSTPRLEYLHIHDLKLTMKEQPFWDDYLFLKSVAQK